MASRDVSSSSVCSVLKEGNALCPRCGFHCSYCDAPFLIPYVFCKNYEGRHIFCPGCSFKLENQGSRMSKCPVGNSECGASLIGIHIGLPQYMQALLKMVPFHCPSATKGCSFIGFGNEVVEHHNKECKLGEFKICQGKNVEGYECMEVVPNEYNLMTHLMNEHNVTFPFKTRVTRDVTISDRDIGANEWLPVPSGTLIDYSLGGEHGDFCKLFMAEGQTHLVIWVAHSNPESTAVVPFTLVVPSTNSAGKTSKSRYEFKGHLLPYSRGWKLGDDTDEDNSEYFELRKSFVQKHSVRKEQGWSFQIEILFGNQEKVGDQEGLRVDASTQVPTSIIKAPKRSKAPPGRLTMVLRSSVRRNAQGCSEGI